MEHWAIYRRNHCILKSMKWIDHLTSYLDYRMSMSYRLADILGYVDGGEEETL